MKKIIFAICVFCGITMGANAQESKYWIGGSVGFDTYKVKDSDDSATKNFQFTPEFGVNLSDSWGLGIAVGYSHFSGLAVDDEYFGKGNAFSIAPFARYTFFKKDLVSLFVDGGINYTSIHVNGYDDNANEFKVGLTPGIALNLAPNVKLLGKFGFLGYTNHKEGDYKANGFNLGVDLTQVQLGINFLF